jgi:hypothetical protein
MRPSKCVRHTPPDPPYQRDGLEAVPWVGRKRGTGGDGSGTGTG